MTGSNKELHSYTQNYSMAATSHVTAATMQGSCLFSPGEDVPSGQSLSKADRK